MHMTVSIRLDDGQVVSARQDIFRLHDDYLAETASDLAWSLSDEAYAVLAEGE